MTAIAKLKYSGSVPGADASTYTLFSSIVGGNVPGQPLGNTLDQMRRYLLTIKNVAAGTLNGYVSADRGMTWQQFYGETMVAHTVPVDRAIRFDASKDVKFEWVNGGTAQTAWYVAQAFDDGEGLDVLPNPDSVFSTALGFNFVAKAAPGRLYAVTVQIDGTAGSDDYYVQFWNATAAPADAVAVTAANSLAAPFRIDHTTGTASTRTFDFGSPDVGLEFEIGCVVGISTTQFTKTAAGSVAAITAVRE